MSYGPSGSALILAAVIVVGLPTAIISSCTTYLFSRSSSKQEAIKQKCENIDSRNAYEKCVEGMEK